jgi:hypothetical protein
VEQIGHGRTRIGGCGVVEVPGEPSRLQPDADRFESRTTSRFEASGSSARVAGRAAEFAQEQPAGFGRFEITVSSEPFETGDHCRARWFGRLGDRLGDRLGGLDDAGKCEQCGGESESEPTWEAGYAVHGHDPQETIRSAGRWVSLR